MEKIKKLIDKYGAEAYNKLKEPIFFINEIIGFDAEPYRLTPYQEEWINLVENNDRLNIAAFRSSGKTETLLIDYPIFKSFTQAGWQGIITSNSQKQSISILRRIREKILGNEILRTSVPSGKQGLWSKTELQLKNSSIIWSKPRNENLPGEHVNYMGNDETGYETDMDIPTKIIPPMVVAKNGKIVWIGTTVSKIDLIHQLKKNPSYVTKWYPANLKFLDKTLWEHRYPSVPIGKIRREYDSLSWSREFLLEPLSSKDRIYPYELISQCFDYDNAFHMTRRGERAYYIGLDFALSGEAASDYTVYTIIEKYEDILRVINIERYKGLNYQSQKHRIVQLGNIYKPIKVVADEGSFGKSFISDLLAEHLPVEGFRFTNQSKQELHTNLRNLFEQKRILINMDQNDLKTKTLTSSLVKELSNFGIVWDEQKLTVKFEGTGEHDDMVTSLGLAAWAARGLGTVSWNVLRGKSTSKSSIFQFGTVN